MKATIVYESHWGNTAAVARAIAEGIGPGTEVLTTDEATPAHLGDADLIIAGAPVIAFGLPSETFVRRLPAEPAPTPPDVSHPPMRTWLASLPARAGRGPRFATFETAVRWSPGGATGTMAKALAEAGFEALAKGRRFLVHGKYGPLRDGELDKARAWGRELAQAMAA